MPIAVNSFGGINFFKCAGGPLYLPTLQSLELHPKSPLESSLFVGIPHLSVKNFFPSSIDTIIND